MCAGTAVAVLAASGVFGGAERDYPSVPKVPSFSRPAKDLRASAKQLSEMHA